MMVPKKPDAGKKDDPEQSKRFEEAARELEADESAASFDLALGVVVPTKGVRKTEDKKRG